MSKTVQGPQIHGCFGEALTLELRLKGENRRRTALWGREMETKNILLDMVEIKTKKLGSAEHEVMVRTDGSAGNATYVRTGT